jgi:hypothetical protein
VDVKHANDLGRRGLIPNPQTAHVYPGGIVFPGALIFSKENMKAFREIIPVEDLQHMLPDATVEEADRVRSRICNSFAGNNTLEQFRSKIQLHAEDELAKLRKES